MWEYDPQTKSWTSLKSLPSTPRYHPAFVAKDGKIYVGLGSSGNGNNLNDWWEYDIAADTWARKANFPGDQRHHPYYFVANNEIFVGLGHGVDFSGSVPQSRIYDDWYKYDPSTDTWTQMGDFPGYARVAGAHFAYNGKGYILGGQNQSHATPVNNEVWSYNPLSDNWTQLPDCPSGGRWAPGSFLVGGNAYFAFGEDISGTSQADIYQVSMANIIGLEEKANLKDISVSLYLRFAFSSRPIILDGTDLGNDIKVEFYNNTGQLVKTSPLVQNSNTLNIADLAKGMYTLHIQDEKSLNKTYLLSLN